MSRAADSLVSSSAGTAPTTLVELSRALHGTGLVIRGAFPVTRADHVPAIRQDLPAAALVLVGNTGPSMWAPFVASPEYRDGEPHPLDRWSRRIADMLTARMGAIALFPFGGPPHHPFQRWAARAEALKASPLGILIHPEYGLWHAYRFALALSAVPPDIMYPASVESPCLSCSGTPCLNACPVAAISGDGYRFDACISHVRASPTGACRSGGCLARFACPVGQAFRYRSAQTVFHMQSFASALHH